MNRRDLLTRLLTGAAGLAIGAELDIERLLWVPKPIITVPAMPSSGVLSTDWITREALRVLENNLMSWQDGRTYDDQFASRFSDTLRIRSPRRVA